MANKTLWVIGASAESLVGIRQLKALGLHLVVADGNPDAPGFVCADHRVVVSTYDVDAMVRASLEYRSGGNAVDGVLAMCADVPVTAAAVARALGLPGLAPETARAVADKLLMKERLMAAGVPVPWFCPVHSLSDLESLARRRGFPFVIKPIDSRGARGVLLIEKADQLEWAFGFAQSYSPTGRVMAEQYLEGQQISTETLCVGGRYFTPAFADRNYEWLDWTKPFFIENGGQSPSSLSADERLEVVQVAEAAAEALGIHQGVAKGDLVMTNHGPCVIEVAGRLSGGYFCTVQTPLATGVPFVELAARLALGERPSPDACRARFEAGVASRCVIAPAGRVRRITGLDAALALPGVVRVDMEVGVGDDLAPLSDMTQRCGFVITTGADAKEAVARAERAVSVIHIDVERPAEE